MGNRRSRPAVVSYEEATSNLDTDQIKTLNEIFTSFKDKRDGISGHVFWKDFLKFSHIKHAESVSNETLWRLFAIFNYRGGGYLSQKEFISACYILAQQNKQLFQELIFAAFSSESCERLSRIELKNLLEELIVGNRISEWRAYPRHNITMSDFEPLSMLLADAAIAQVTKEKTTWSRPKLLPGESESTNIIDIDYKHSEGFSTSSYPTGLDLHQKKNLKLTSRNTSTASCTSTVAAQDMNERSANIKTKVSNKDKVQVNQNINGRMQSNILSTRRDRSTKLTMHLDSDSFDDFGHQSEQRINIIQSTLCEENAANATAFSGLKIVDSIDVEQWHEFAVTQKHVQNLVSVLCSVGARIFQDRISADHE